MLRVSRRSVFGLNAANFFVGQAVAVVLPFLNDLLREHGWRYDAIGVASAMTGLGVLLMQAPAGMIVDAIGRPRALLALASVGLGLGYGAVPVLFEHRVATQGMLFLSGASQAFLTPLLAALALSLAGHDGLSRMLGKNRVWHHAGEIAAALLAMLAVSRLGTTSVFVAVSFGAALTALSCALIRPEELGAHAPMVTQPPVVGAEPRAAKAPSLVTLLRDKRVFILLVATTLFHSANAPVIPLVALYIKHLRGTLKSVGAMLLLGQAVMIPVAALAGRLCDRFGRKPIFAIAFLALPVRIFLCSLTDEPSTLVAIQGLDGIGAGIEAVAIASICADITRNQGKFNTLLGILATPVGGVIGPLVTGVLVEAFGFVIAFQAMAIVAVIGAAIFLMWMPETLPAKIGGAAITPGRT